MKISLLVTEYLALRSPGWLVLSEPEALDCGIKAARMYHAYGQLASLQPAQRGPDHVVPDTELSASEWGVISPLFVLYLEFDNAQRLEATRTLGLDPYGRSAESVAAEIRAYEEEMPRKAFTQPVRILGVNSTDTLPLPPVGFVPPCLY